MNGPVTVMVPSPEGCVLVRLRHESDDGLGHALGWFRLEAMADLPALVQRLDVFFPDADGDEGGGITTQLIAQNGAAWVELVIADGGDDDE